VTQLHAGQKVRVRLDFETEITDVHLPRGAVNVVNPAGTDTLRGLPVSAITPIITPEPGDIWRADGEQWACYKYSEGTKKYMQRCMSRGIGNPEADRFLQDYPDAVLLFRSSDA
jgi:hypothetical protein